MEITVSGRFEELCLKKVSIVGQNLTREHPGLRLDVGFGDSRVAYVYPEDCVKPRKGNIPVKICAACHSLCIEAIR